jgi:hypothetical protein
MRFATAQYRSRAARIAADARERAEFENIAEKLGALKITFRREGTVFRFHNVDELLTAREYLTVLNKYRCRCAF